MLEPSTPTAETPAPEPAEAVQPASIPELVEGAAPDVQVGPTPTEVGSDGGDAEDEIVRVIVISDIHATQATSEETNVAEENAEDLERNALSALRPFLLAHFDAADLIVCPGDLVHQGKTDPIKWVWGELKELAAELDAELFGTAGNHDLALQPDPGQKASRSLRELDPMFPCGGQADYDAYWSTGFVVLERGSFRVLLVNSSAHLGGFRAEENTYGRFTSESERALRKRFGDSEASVGICICHHHPQEWVVDSDAKMTHMRRGDRLIEILEERTEPWALIHGHSHFPRLDYVGNRSGGPARLASGSIGANLLEDSGTNVRNQMHVIEFNLSAAAKYGLRLAGTVQSFDWTNGVGWDKALPDSGLPAETAFGYRRDGFELASWVKEQSEGGKAWTWAELESLEPRLTYLNDDDRADFFSSAKRLGAGVQEGIMEVTFT